MVEENSREEQIGEIKKRNLERQTEIFDEVRDSLRQEMVGERGMDGLIVDEVIEIMRPLLTTGGRGKIMVTATRTRHELSRDYSSRDRLKMERAQAKLEGLVDRLKDIDVELIIGDQKIATLELEIEALQYRLDTGTSSLLEKFAIQDQPISMPIVTPNPDRVEEGGRARDDRNQKAARDPAELILDESHPLQVQGD